MEEIENAPPQAGQEVDADQVQPGTATESVPVDGGSAKVDRTAVIATYVQILANAAAVGALIVTLWQFDVLATVGKLEDQLEQKAAAATAAQQARERSLLDLSLTRAEARRLADRNATASERALDLQGDISRLTSHATLIQADLRTRLQDLARARDEVRGLEGKAAGLSEAYKGSLQKLSRMTLAAFVSLHLAQEKTHLIGHRHEFTMLFNDADPAFERFKPYAVFQAKVAPEAPAPSQCALSSRFVFVGTIEHSTVDVRSDPVLQALCAFLHERTGFVRLDDAVRGLDSGRPVGTMERWEELGDDGPFLLSLQLGGRDGDSFEEATLRSYWSLVGTRGVLSLPGFDDEPMSGPETDSLTGELETFLSGWPKFIEKYRSQEIIDQLFALGSSGSESPPLLPRLARISVASLRSGKATTTEEFEQRVHCAAAWYAEERGLITEQVRKLHCGAI